MGLFGKLFGSSNEAEMAEREALVEFADYKERVLPFTIEELVAAGLEPDDRYYVMSYKKAEEYFKPIEDMIRNADPAVIDYFYFMTGDIKQFYKNMLTDPRQAEIWKMLFADFHFCYGNYDIEEEERLAENCIMVAPNAQRELFVTVGFRGYKWIDAETFAGLEGKKYSNDSEQEITDFIAEMLEKLPYAYESGLSATIQDGRILLDGDDLLDYFSYTGAYRKDIFATMGNLIDSINELLEIPIAQSSEMIERECDIYNYLKLASEKKYIEAIKLADEKGLLKGGYISELLNNVEIYESFDEETRQIIDDYFANAPEGRFEMRFDKEEEEFVCAFLGYYPVMTYEDENLFDLQKGEVAYNCVILKDYTGSFDGKDVCEPFTTIVDEYSEKMMDEEWED